MVADQLSFAYLKYETTKNKSVDEHVEYCIYIVFLSWVCLCVDNLVFKLADKLKGL